MNCAICSIILRALKGVMPESIATDISRRMASIDIDTKERTPHHQCHAPQRRLGVQSGGCSGRKLTGCFLPRTRVFGHVSRRTPTTS